MVLETGIEPSPEPQQQQRQDTSNAATAKEDELEPVIEATTSGSVLFDKAYKMMERFAATRIGQFVLERGDRVLRIFEDTVKWSLPHDEVDVPLVRPLPWIPFILLIILLRQLRIWLSLGALLIGDGPVTAQSLVYFIQTRRRKLRSIRMHGLKAIQQREHAIQQLDKAPKSEQVGGLMVKLGKLFTIAVCRPRYHCEPAGKVFAEQNSALQELLRHLESPRFTYKRQREDDCPEDELNCSQLLSKYANENSDDDSDYVPIQEEEDTNNESTLSVNSSNDTQGEYSMDTSDENAKDLSFTEKEEPKENKPSKENKMPTIEINAKEAENNSASNNTDHSDKKQAVLVESVKAVTVSPKTPHTPLDNGPNKNDELGGAAAVVQTHEVSKPQNEHFFNLLNGHADVQIKSTPGHESAADTKPHLPSPLLGNVINAITPDPKDPTDGTLVDAIDDCSARPIEILTNIPQPPPPPTPPQPPLLSSLSSPSCSTTSSTSSLASFETSNDYDFVDDGRSDPLTPTNSLDAASSSEDVFLSPFGSPPNFNTFHNPLSSQHNTIVTFGATEDPSAIDDDIPMPKPKQFKSQPEHKTHQQQKQSHHQRYRRNRR